MYRYFSVSQTSIAFDDTINLPML